jgi:hypothetical protein
VLHEARLTGVGQTGTIGVDKATSKVEVQVCEPQASVTVYVNVRLVPAHEAPAGRAGRELILVVALQPPVKLKPVDQVV